VAILSGDLSGGGLLGPFVNRSQNDIALLNDFLTAAGGTAQPRGILAQGDAFVESETMTGGIDPAHTQFLTDKLGLRLRSSSYSGLSGNPEACADLLTTTSMTTNGDTYGMMNSPCAWRNQVLERNTALPEAVEASYYENVGSNGPYVADVLKTAVPQRNWVALTSGYEIEHIRGMLCQTTAGSIAYFYQTLNQVFGSLCSLTGPACLCLDVPQSGRGGPFVNFMKVGDAVMRKGGSSVLLGVTRTERVRVRIYDVTGRLVRTLADRVFPPGEHTLAWDGAADDGRRVPRGVFFVNSSNQPGSRRVVVLGN
jgi:hypothetical protein